MTIRTTGLLEAEGVGRGEITYKNTQRSAIGNRMKEYEREDVMVGCQTKHLDPVKRPTHHVKRFSKNACHHRCGILSQIHVPASEDRRAAQGNSPTTLAAAA